MGERNEPTMRRRDLLALIGTSAGGAAMYRAMSSLGFAAESTYSGPIRLDGDPKGASVLILGAGLAGLVAAFELRKAGYRVQVLEYNNRAGGRCWSLRGGDSYTELGGGTQQCEFASGLYLNPGPWRIPYHYHGVLDYCRTVMAFCEREELRILFLDKRNRLIEEERQQVGTVDHTPVYPREVVKRALELSATAIILVHNHPSGDPTPSRADIEMTQAIIAVARPLGISVHDHIIVGKEGHASLKALKLI